MAKKKKGIGLALGGGGIRACVHIGIYDVLRKNKIPITCVAGTSMGSVIGAGIAMDFEPEEIKEKIMSLKDKHFLSWRQFNFFSESLFKRKKLDEALRDALNGFTFKDTKVPFACTAVDLESKQEVVLDDGLLWKAVAAAISYPPLFAPKFYKHGYLVDGGILDAVPAVLARELGADPLVAIDVDSSLMRQAIAGRVYMKHMDSPLKKAKSIFKKFRFSVELLIDNIFEIVSIAAGANSEANIKKAKPELLIHEYVNFPFLGFDQMDEIIEHGRVIGEKYLPAIKKLLKDK